MAGGELGGWVLRPQLLWHVLYLNRADSYAWLKRPVRAKEQRLSGKTPAANTGKTSDLMTLIRHPEVGLGPIYHELWFGRTDPPPVIISCQPPGYIA